jgi:hypothetical protein
MLNAETESGAVKPAPLRRMVIEAESQLNPTGPSNGAGAPQLAIRNGADRRIISLMLLLEQKLTQIWLER